MNWQTFISTLLGACVSYSAIMLTYMLERRKRKRSDEKLKRALLHGLHDEINGLLTMVKLNPEGELAQEMYEAAFGLTEDYFTVYHANVALVIQIENDELRQLIVRTYTLGKAFVTRANINKQCLDRLHYLESTYHKTKDPAVQISVEKYRQIKDRLVKEIKAADIRFHSSAQQLIALLAKEGRF
ncbi:MAG: hypothetical protein ABSH48_03540 [Verrucomicrobiota bacterium]|jgi:hypothetical protein